MEGREERVLYIDEACVSCGSVEALNVKIKRREVLALRGYET